MYYEHVSPGVERMDLLILCRLRGEYGKCIVFVECWCVDG